MNEVKEKRVAGPFAQIPFNNYVQSPIGLVPKAGGKTRLIFHLSYDFSNSNNPSVNSCTPKDYCSVKYNDLDHAIKNSFRWRNDFGQIFYSKTNLKSAFKILPLKVRCYHWLIMKAGSLWRKHYPSDIQFHALISRDFLML